MIMSSTLMLGDDDDDDVTYDWWKNYLMCATLFFIKRNPIIAQIGLLRGLYPNLIKSSYEWSQVWLHCKIEKNRHWMDAFISSQA